jgi:putative addiction module killer protein
MSTVLSTDVFDAWLDGLSDKRARLKIDVRIRRLGLGHFGDVKPVGDGISELRIHHGPGYRVYFVQRGRVVIVLLCGGDKSTQARDIRAAQALAADLEV